MRHPIPTWQTESVTIRTPPFVPKQAWSGSRIRKLLGASVLDRNNFPREVDTPQNFRATFPRCVTRALSSALCAPRFSWWLTVFTTDLPPLTVVQIQGVRRMNKIDGTAEKKICDHREVEKATASRRLTRRPVERSGQKSAQRKIKSSGDGPKCTNGDHPFRRVSRGLPILVSRLWKRPIRRFRDSPPTTFLLSLLADEPLLSQPPLFYGIPNIPWRQITPASLRDYLYATPPPRFWLNVIYKTRALPSWKRRTPAVELSALIVRLKMTQELHHFQPKNHNEFFVQTLFRAIRSFLYICFKLIDLYNYNIPL